jgi:translation initiation factor 1 (eIF-1/SUI1)
MSYHKRKIRFEGSYGSIYKILEEADEAQEQNNKILIHVELSDIYGALETVAKNYNLSMEDLKSMSDATKRAFESGSRK